MLDTTFLCYIGADLQALLGTAQLNAIHDRLASLSAPSSPHKEKAGGETEAAGGMQLTKAHLYDALAST
jgi:hypothetical protein